MKITNLFSSILFTILAIFCIVACKKEIADTKLLDSESRHATNNNIDDLAQEGYNIVVKMPVALEEKSNEEKIDFLNKAPREYILNSIESYRVEHFLEQVGKVEAALKIHGKDFFYTEASVRDLLTPMERTALANYKVQNLGQERWCQTAGTICIIAVKYRLEYCCGWFGCYWQHTVRIGKC